MKSLYQIVLALMVFIAQVAYSAQSPEADTTHTTDAIYRNAVAQARAGHHSEALAALRPLVEQYPERQDIVGDYAVVLGWSGDDASALIQMDKIDRKNAPAYVIESLANSARRVQRYDLATALYNETFARYPDRVEPQIGLAHTLADSGDVDAATKRIEDLQRRYPLHKGVLEVAADIAIIRHDYFAALTAYQTILSQDAKNRIALRGKVRILALLGAPQLAIELSDRTPGILSASERESLTADRTAHHIRWGAIAADNGLGVSRFAALDEAITDSEAVVVKALDPDAELNTTERQLVLDRISALREGYRMKDAVALYEAMARRSAELPSYVKSAAASAYLYIQQPKKARDLYREALATDPNNLESNIGLFYALAENEEHDAALEQIDHAVAITPQWIDAWSPATIRENPVYPGVLSAQAMGALLANQPGKAQERLHDLVGMAPYNMDIRTDYASSMRARGWPRRAEQELRWILELNPVSSGALGERAGALLEMQDYREAESALAQAQEAAPEDGRVIRAGRLWQVHNMNEFIVEGNYGRSSGGGQSNVGPTGTEDFSLESWLYSKPIDYNYRVFGHVYSAQAKFENSTGRRERAGVGLEYRSPWVVASGELIRGNDDKTAAALSLAITPDDYWTFRTQYETSSNQTPLQASQAGVDANRLAGEVEWQANESRSVALGYGRMNFTDGNQRDSVETHWTERVVAGPIYKLEVTGALDASRNSRDDAAYFNPSRDFSSSIEFANEWLQWRRYTRDFRHRVVVSVGNYWQEDFGTGLVYDAHYEQEWNADDRLALRYGIGHKEHPYDGDQTPTDYAYFYLNWRF